MPVGGRETGGFAADEEPVLGSELGGTAGVFDEVVSRSGFLTILGSSKGGPGDKVGKAEFAAEYYEGGQRHKLRERSRFKRDKGDWKYLDGKG